MELASTKKKEFDIYTKFPEEGTPQRIDEYQVMYIKEGSGKVQLDFTEYEIQANQLFFISEKQLFRVLDNQNLQVKVIRFSNDFFCIKLHRNEVFCDAVIFNTAHKQPSVSLDASAKKRIESLLDAMWQELQETHDFQEDLIISYLKTFLLYASKLKLKLISNFKIERLSSLMIAFQDLLEQHYKERHDVQFYASNLNIGLKGLNKVSKKELGRTTTELIKDKLIIEAKRELYQNHQSIKEISYNLGFEDPAYFSRFFKKATSFSPKEYQNFILVPQVGVTL